MIKQPATIISLIVAADRNGVIGRNGAMPWHLPGDLRYFKQVTMGKPVIMGQKTWDSLKKRPLAGRANIILTRQRGFEAQGAYIAHSLAEALNIAENQAAADNKDEIFIIGGGEVFKQALPFAGKLYVTEILADIGGDTFFKPSLPGRQWRKTLIAAPAKQEKDSHAYRFLVYEKRAERKTAQKSGSLFSAFGKNGPVGLSLRRLFSVF